MVYFSYVFISYQYFNTIKISLLLTSVESPPGCYLPLLNLLQDVTYPAGSPPGCYLPCWIFSRMLLTPAGSPPECYSPLLDLLQDNASQKVNQECDNHHLSQGPTTIGSTLIPTSIYCFTVLPTTCCIL